MNEFLDRWLDLSVVAAFLVAIFSVAISTRFKFRDIRDFSVGDRNYSTPVLLASLFSCLICGLTTIGLPGLVFSYGFWPVIGLLGISIQELIIAFFITPKMSRFAGM